MFCMKCGKEVKEGTGFCIFCGTPVPVKKTEDKKQEKKPETVGKQQKTEKEKTSLIDIRKDRGVTGGKVQRISLDEEPEVIEEDEIAGFIEDDIIIEDPYAEDLIDVKKAEEEAQEREDIQYAKEKIREIAPGEEAASILYPLSSPNVKGYKCFFIGNDGTKKDEAIMEVGKILHITGKTRQEEPVYLNFSQIPQEFETDLLYVIEDLSSAITWLFNLDDLSDESSHMQHKYQKLMELLLKAPTTAYIILNAQPGILKGFQSLDPRIHFLFSRKIEFPDLTNGELYQIFYEFLPEFHQKQLPPNYEDTFKEYMKRNRRFFPFNNRDLAAFLAEASSRNPEFQLPKEKYNDTAMEDAFNSIIGMENVKRQAEELALYLKARKEMEERGATLPHFHLHMMFLGNPGVGKTTIARILAKLLFDLGYIREDKLIEVSSKDLVGAFGNQTGMKTNRVILRALGGVLFVDEAYSLAKSCGQAGEEVIATLVKAMEDYKGDLVVMFAGYTLEMNDFVKVNSGIASRIAYTFQFKDYTVEELFKIYELKAKKSGLFIAKDAVPEIMKIIEWGHTRKNFGNGRYIDKLLQRTLTKHATLNIPKKDMLTIRKESIPQVEEIMETFGRFLG